MRERMRLRILVNRIPAYVLAYVAKYLSYANGEMASRVMIIINSMKAITDIIKIAKSNNAAVSQWNKTNVLEREILF